MIPFGRIAVLAMTMLFVLTLIWRGSTVDNAVTAVSALVALTAGQGWLPPRRPVPAVFTNP